MKFISEILSIQTGKIVWFLFKIGSKVSTIYKLKSMELGDSDFLRFHKSLPLVSNPQHFFVVQFSGERTFGVLTKIDLMDKGTDAVDVSQLLIDIEKLWWYHS